MPDTESNYIFHSLGMFISAALFTFYMIGVLAVTDTVQRDTYLYKVFLVHTILVGASICTQMVYFFISCATNYMCSFMWIIAFVALAHFVTGCMILYKVPPLHECIAYDNIAFGPVTCGAMHCIGILVFVGLCILGVVLFFWFWPRPQ